ncbi:hypothetical protein [Paraburkholderia sp. SIMBA_054]|uniref:hypothetical protein n=1 Tax=Paraburkholderia sp. SIMBA_054 TaxID=3085795 RepID=UPI003978D54B
MASTTAPFAIRSPDAQPGLLLLRASEIEVISKARRIAFPETPFARRLGLMRVTGNELRRS